jgi:hypothetical protein
MDKPKLLDRVHSVARLRHLSLGTERAYSDWTKRFIRFHKKRHPKEMGEEEVRQFLAVGLSKEASLFAAHPASGSRTHGTLLPP